MCPERVHAAKLYSIGEGSRLEDIEHDDIEDAAQDGESPAPGRSAVAATALLISFLLLYAVMVCLSFDRKISLIDFATRPFDAQILQMFGCLKGDALASGEIWRIVTAAFVHLNLIHLVFNCFCVYSLGKAVESFYGARRMFILYVGCTIAANLTTVAVSSSSSIQVGTLGGLFGLDGVLLGFALRNRSVLPPKSFYRMIFGAIFWPVFWVFLALLAFKGKGNIEGLLAGFGAGAVLGLLFRAVKFREQPAGPRPAMFVSMLFSAAIAVCLVSWIAHFRAEFANFVSSDTAEPFGDETRERSREFPGHVSEKGGFEIPVPEGTSVREEEGKLEIWTRNWAICIVTWRDAEGMEDPYEIAWQVRSHLNQEDFHPEGGLTYPEIGREQAVYFEMSRDQQGRRTLYAQATLIHAGRVYTIIFRYLADDDTARNMAGGILKEFRFISREEKQ